MLGCLRLCLNLNSENGNLACNLYFDHSESVNCNNRTLVSLISLFFFASFPSTFFNFFAQHHPCLSTEAMTVSNGDQIKRYITKRGVGGESKKKIERKSRKKR